MSEVRGGPGYLYPEMIVTAVPWVNVSPGKPPNCVRRSASNVSLSTECIWRAKRQREHVAEDATDASGEWDGDQARPTAAVEHPVGIVQTEPRYQVVEGLPTVSRRYA